MLAHHYPGVPNLGDMTKIKGEDYRGLVDLLVGGTLCQAFSLAGLRGGLADPRGQLTFKFIELLGAMRPRWVVWENVPGVLSDDGGRTFGAFLGALAECGYGFAYRVLDAQYFGVPQRRRRVFVVGHLGDWGSAAAVLFERHSLSGDSPPRRGAGAEIANAIGARSLNGGHGGTNGGAGNHYIPAIVSQAMSCKWSKGTSGPAGDEHHNLVSYAIQRSSINPNPNAGPQGKGWQPDIAFTLDADHRSQSVVYAPEVLPIPVTAHWSKGSGSGAGNEHTNLIVPDSTLAVRRLTPLEAERLQGFPDNYTNISHGNRKSGHAPDGPRYKALGNSMAVPVMRWIGERIEKITKLKETE